MIDSKERARREEAHALADYHWSGQRRRSRTNGLADALRSIGTSKTTPTEVRKLRQDMHKTRLRDAAAKALKWSNEHRPWNPRHLDRSRYFPHQSERERTRCTGQAERLMARHQLAQAA